MENLLEFNPGMTPVAGGRCVLGIGVFDGVHPGHRSIMESAVRMAAENDAVPAALTFDPHPRAVLRPDEPPLLLQSIGERIGMLHEAGAKEVWVARFSRELSSLPPEAFLDCLVAIPTVKLVGIAVGRQWRFGRGGVGDTALLERCCAERGLKLAAVPEVRLNGRIVSSSAIRQAISAGRLEEAAQLLGRPYRLTGVVEGGYQAATEKLECPTANLAFRAGVLPPDGVYAARAFVGEKAHPAVVNIGFAPTFGWENARRRVEVHLLDFSGNLYGTRLGVEFLRHLREERTFADPSELKRQISCDLRQVREYYRELE